MHGRPARSIKLSGPSSDPKGGSERPLHQLAWSQALLAGELAFGEFTGGPVVKTLSSQ